MTEQQINGLSVAGRNGLIDKKYRWPNGRVPYELSPAHTKQQRDQIEAALKHLESVSCIKFVPHTNEVDYIKIQVSKMVLFARNCLE